MTQQQDARRKTIGILERGAEAILLACTELFVLFAGCRPRWPVPTFDAAQVMAERVIILAGGEVKHPLPGAPTRVTEDGA